jgi:ABC-2 type transport system permease protein
MLAQGIMVSVNVLFERGDMDLLLSSPIEARTVFIVRALGVAVSCSALYVILLSPFADVGPLIGRPGLLAIYPTLFALGLLISAIAMWITLSLVRWVGARRARIFAQVLGSFIGAAFFLLTQAQSIVASDRGKHAANAAIRWFQVGGPLEPASQIWLPLRALMGDPLSLLVLLALAVSSFGLVTNLSYRRFLEGTQASVTGSGSRRAPRALGHTRFRTGLMRTVLIKEWTMIRRDPNLIAQTLLQSLYLLPMIFLVWRKEAPENLLVAGCILLATTLAGNLAWITVAAEDAPELIGSAPVEPTSIRWLKMLAAMIPVWVLLSPVFLVLLVHEAYAGVVFAIGLSGATLSAGVIQIWYPQRGKRSDLARRARSGGWLLGILELVSALGWAGLAWALLSSPLLAVLALPFAIAGPLAAWSAGRARREGDMIL